MKLMLSFLLSLSLCAAIVTGVNYASAEDASATVTAQAPSLLGDHERILLAQADTGSAAATSSPPTASSGSAAPLPAHVCTLDGKQIDCAQLAEHPAESASEVTTLWKAGSFASAIILALFVLLSWASKHFEWLEQGKRAAYTATALTFLTLLVEPASRGTTPTLSMIMSAAGGALLFFMNAKKPLKPAAPANG